MLRPRLIIAKGKEKALQRRHPWIFSGAVQRVEGHPQVGDLVDVYDAAGVWIATGHYQDESIICKVLSYDTNQIDDDFFMQRIRQAVDYRRQMGFFDNTATNVFRLVNSEGDFLPGLICDYYGGVLVMQAHSMGMHRLLPMLADCFAACLGEKMVSVFDKSSATLPEGAATDGYLRGIEPDEWEIVEDGNHMMINFFEGQKTGFFIDQRENRHLLGTLSEGRRVLNCFGYTGGFSLAALRGGASYVETVDISRKAIDLCNRNVQMNFGVVAPHKGVVADVLHYIDSMDAAFDIVVLDPPAFAKNHRSLQQGLKGYRAINSKALRQIKSGGLLFTFSCSQAVSVDDFRTMVFSAAAMAHRDVRVVRVLPHAIDHPVSIYHPEGEYLKGLLLHVI